MKLLGICLVVVGLFWGIIAFNMETTVTTEGRTFGEGLYSIRVPSQTVHNLDRADQRRNHLIGSAVTLIAGILLFGFGSMKPKEAIASTPTQGRKCPFCAEVVKEEAIVCRFCGKDLPIVEKPKENIHTITIDDQNRIECPQCNAKLKLDEKELRANKFWCPDCKTENKFIATI